MNLATDPWIPVAWENGESSLVSLRDAFRRGHEIRDLAVRPHERIALMRLLICVAQAALDGPADFDAWKECRPRIAPAALDYLKRWEAAFELVGEGPRFLQWRGKTEATIMSVHKMTFVDKDSPTVFNHDSTSETGLSPEKIALALLTFQCFSAGGRVEGATDSLKAGLCRQGSALHTFIRRDRLEETIYLNLLTKEQVEGLAGLRWGRPVWELAGTSVEEMTAARKDMVQGYLSRLVPATRNLWLRQNLEETEARGGTSYFGHPELLDPTTTTVATKKGERMTVAGDVERAIWRELHSLVVRRAASSGVGGPLALANVPSAGSFDIWTGALAGDRAKVVDTVESVFHIPTAMLADPAQRTYEKGVEHAQKTAYRLQDALSLFRLALEANEDGMGGYQKRLMMLKGQDKDRLRNLFSAALAQYWTDVEQRVGDLLSVAEDPTPLGTQGAWHATSWGKAAWRAALAAYDRACPHETARQIRAYALGRRKLLEA